MAAAASSGCEDGVNWGRDDSESLEWDISENAVCTGVRGRV